MKQAKTTRVAVIGSLNIDYFARVDHFPAPGETVTAGSLRIFRGGKGGNQAIAAARQGVAVHFIGAIGNDDEGLGYLVALSDEGIDTSRITKATDRTGTAFITLDRTAENSIVIAAGANDSLTPTKIRRASSLLGSCQAVLGQFEIPGDSLVEAARIANSASVPVIINPSPDNPSFPWQEIRTDYLIVNEGEAERYFGFPFPGEDPALVRQQLHELRIDHLIITCGGDDTLVYRRDGAPISVETLPVLPIDTVGAGDAFAGCFAARIASGESLEAAVRAANCAGALTTLGAGAQDPIPDREKVNQHLEHLTAHL